MDSTAATPRRLTSPREFTDVARNTANAYRDCLVCMSRAHAALTIARNADGSLTLTPAEADKVLALLEARS